MDVFCPWPSRSACSPASSPSTTALICPAMVYTRCWLFQIKASSWQDIRSTYSKRRKRKSLRPLSASWGRGTTPYSPSTWLAVTFCSHSQPTINHGHQQEHVHVRVPGRIQVQVPSAFIFVHTTYMMSLGAEC